MGPHDSVMSPHPVEDVDEGATALSGENVAGTSLKNTPQDELPSSSSADKKRKKKKKKAKNSATASEAASDDRYVQQRLLWPHRALHKSFLISFQSMAGCLPARLCRKTLRTKSRRPRKCLKLLRR